MQHIRNIVWDFNGTLLDDFRLCLTSINQLLKKRELPFLSSDKYLEIFTFPIRDYYTSAGFDFDREPFEDVAVEFMDLYLDQVAATRLHKGVEDSLRYFQHKNFSQIILSAMEHTELTRFVNHHGIGSYFQAIYGIDNHLAASKLSLAQIALAQSGFAPSETCLLGDTLHDAEVARAIGVDCILISNGHQSKARLQTSGFTVLESLSELPSVFG